MKERPILFNAPMVRAILSGQKAQTRRTFNNKANWHFIEGQGDLSICPYGQPGDRLWVRETWQYHDSPISRYRPGTHVYYRADYLDDPHGPDGECSPEGKYRTWRPSIHMPRAASRIVLEITDVRVERLQDISETDCLAEGIQQLGEKQGWACEAQFPDGKRHFGAGAYDLFRQLWDSINGPGSWSANPWVWVVEFRRIEP